MSIRYILGAAALVAICAAPVARFPAVSAAQKLDQALTARVADGTPGHVRVIVRATSDEQPLSEVIGAHHGVTVPADRSRGTMTATFAVNELRSLAADSRVAGLSIDAPVKGMGGGGDGRDTAGLLLSTMNMPGPGSPAANRRSPAL